MLALVISALVIGALRGVHKLVQATAVSVRCGKNHYGAINCALSASVSVTLALAPALGGQLAHVLDSYSSMALVMAVELVLVVLRGRYT